MNGKNSKHVLDGLEPAALDGVEGCDDGVCGTLVLAGRVKVLLAEEGAEAGVAEADTGVDGVEADDSCLAGVEGALLVYPDDPLTTLTSRYNALPESASVEARDKEESFESSI
jgi:hypothetical protein